MISLKHYFDKWWAVWLLFGLTDNWSLSSYIFGSWSSVDISGPNHQWNWPYDPYLLSKKIELGYQIGASFCQIWPSPKCDLVQGKKQTPAYVLQAGLEKARMRIPTSKHFFCKENWKVRQWMRFGIQRSLSKHKFVTKFILNPSKLG